MKNLDDMLWANVKDMHNYWIKRGIYEIEKLVKPLYEKKDSMHNFHHIMRIKKKLTFLKKDYKKIDKERLNFLLYFHGLKD